MWLDYDQVKAIYVDENRAGDRRVPQLTDVAFIKPGGPDGALWVAYSQAVAHPEAAPAAVPTDAASAAAELLIRLEQHPEMLDIPGQLLNHLRALAGMVGRPELEVTAALLPGLVRRGATPAQLATVLWREQLDPQGSYEAVVERVEAHPDLVTALEAAWAALPKTALPVQQVLELTTVQAIGVLSTMPPDAAGALLATAVIDDDSASRAADILVAMPAAVARPILAGMAADPEATAGTLVYMGFEPAAALLNGLPADTVGILLIGTAQNRPSMVAKILLLNLVLARTVLTGWAATRPDIAVRVLVEMGARNSADMVALLNSLPADTLSALLVGAAPNHSFMVAGILLELDPATASSLLAGWVTTDLAAAAKVLGDLGRFVEHGLALLNGMPAGILGALLAAARENDRVTTAKILLGLDTVTFGAVLTGWATTDPVTATNVLIDMGDVNVAHTAAQLKGIPTDTLGALLVAAAYNYSDEIADILNALDPAVATDIRTAHSTLSHLY